MTDATRQYLISGEQAGARYRFATFGRTPQGTAGSQLARSIGESMEFMEHREYQPGDDLRRMNWSAYARSDKLIVKVFRQEVSPHFDLVLDTSRSMALAGTKKEQAALGITAALACAAENSGYRRRIYSTGENGCQPIEGGEHRPQAWNLPQFVSAKTPAQSLGLRPPACQAHGVRAFVSDLLWLGEPLEVLKLLSDRSAATVVIQVLAEEDANPIGIGSRRLIDSETGETLELFIDEAGLQRYRRNLEQHQTAWRLAARQMGVTFVSFVAEELCRDWNLSPLVEAEVLNVA